VSIESVLNSESAQELRILPASGANGSQLSRLKMYENTVEYSAYLMIFSSHVSEPRRSTKNLSYLGFL